MDKNQNANKAELYSGNRQTVGDRLKEYMRKNNAKQVDIIEKASPFFTDNLKITKTDLSQYINNKTEPRSDKLHLLAKALNVDEAWLLGFDKNKHTSPVTYPTQGDDYSINDDLSSYEIKPKNMVETTTKHIPLIGEIACGDPITAEENVEEYITHVFPKGQVPSGDLIDLRAKGHSMEPTIPDGSIVTIRLQPEVEDGEIAAVQVNGDTEATLKRVKHIDGLVMLKPDNDAYDPIIITPSNPATIIGKAIQFTSKL